MMDPVKSNCKFYATSGQPPALELVLKLNIKCDRVFLLVVPVPREQQQQSPTSLSRPPTESKTSFRSDDNAMMRVTQKAAPLGTRNGNAMPLYEKQNTLSTGTLPTSKASTAKTINKSPLTPRIAGSVASVTPILPARKGARQDGHVSPNGSRRGDFPTPVTAFLSNNITPRSSSRKTRVDSANSTPTRTPIGTPAPDALRFVHEASTVGLDSTAFANTSLKRPAASLNPAVHEPTDRNDQPQFEPYKRFFYASDAIQQPKTQPVVPEHKTPSFVYANGNTVPALLEHSRSVIGSVVGSAASEDQNLPKFLHANGVPGSSLELVPPSSSINAPAIYPHLKAPGLVAHNTGRTLLPLQKGTSPPKVHQDNPASAFEYASPLPSPEPPPAQDLVQFRARAQQTLGQASGHERSASTGALGVSPPSQWAPSDATGRSPFPPLSIGVFTSESAKGPDELSSDLWCGGSVTSEICSPIKTGYSTERMDELATNARRERKVLDLEITNSSLAAINRTLEREMRKQTAELRRYRRLGRSGRISIITAASMRTSLETESNLDDAGSMLLSNMVEDLSTDDESTSDEESADDGSLSPGAVVESDARHRRKDEKRLQLDLSKHQQLLIDSQNINRSLKRCLGWTEGLIREGKGALEYSVGVNDIRFGGRVLPPDEIDESGHGDSVSVTNKQIAAIDDTIAFAGWSTPDGP